MFCFESCVNPFLFCPPICQIRAFRAFWPFIKGYESLMNQLSADEAVVFADAAHPTHAVRPVGCWAPKEVPVAVEQSSGRDRLNIHGAIDLETGQTIMKMC